MKSVAFVGNPNVGKSAIINLLAESDLKIGNWSGVTTEKTEAFYTYKNEEFNCVDLPGLYGFSNKSDEERITEQYLNQSEIDCLVNVVDSTTLLNNLNCTLQCRELQIPMVVVLNFDDERIKEGININAQWISKRLSIPVLQMNAFEKDKKELLKEMIHKQSQQPVLYRPLLDRASEQVFYDFFNHNNYSLKEAIKIFNHNHPELSLSNRIQAIQSFSQSINIGSLKQLKLSKQIDKLLLHSSFGYLFGCFVFFLMFSLVFYASKPLSDILDQIMNTIKSIVLICIQSLPVLFQQFIIEGLFNAIHSLFSLLPLLFMLYFAIALLEECGYMARISILVDKFMRVFHLSGKTMLCFVMGFGCNVPAVAATGALENEKMRKKVALLMPFMSCGARLPIYIYFIDLFFKKHQVLVLFILYSTGIVIACFLSIVLDFKENESYFKCEIIELPNYRIPKIAIVLKKSFLECKMFLKKSFMIVLWILMCMWILMNVPGNEIENSYLFQISNSLASIFKPLGFGNHWFFVAALFPSFIAKESVVAFLLLLNPDFTNINNIQLISLSFLLFNCCSIPCIMSCMMLYRKYGVKHLCKSIVLSCVVSYSLSLIVFQFFSMLI